MKKFLPARLPHGTAAFIAAVFSVAASAQSLDFETALRLALDRAPLLQARAASAQGAAALQISAGQLPDPKLMLGIDSLPVSGPNRGSLTRDDFTQRQIGWTQDMPNRAKRAARSDAALARTEREQALLQMERLTVRREAGLAWLARHAADNRLAWFEKLDGHHRLLQETAPAQLAAGKISPSDLTTIRLEALVLADRRDELQREATQAAVLLRRWTGDDRRTGLSAEAPVFKVDRDHLMAQIERSPEIAALTPMRALADAEVREAQAAQTGDWSWSVTYGQRGSGYGNLVSAQLNFELPLAPGQRQQPLIRARLKELERLAGERDELLRRQAQDLQSLLAEQDELVSKLHRLTQQTVPLTAQRTAFTLAAYESGRDKLASVLESRKQQAETGLRALELQGRLRAVQWRLNTLIPESSP